MRAAVSWIVGGGTGRVVSVAMIVILYPTATAAQEDPRVEALVERAGEISGCYELQWGQWSEAGWSDETARLPPRIWLTMASFGPQYYPSDSSEVAVHFVMRPAPGEEEVGYPDVTWVARSEDDSIVLSWSSLFQGVTAVVDVSGSSESWTFSGNATGWTDELQVVEPGATPPPPPSAAVSGRMVECS